LSLAFALEVQKLTARFRHGGRSASGKMGHLSPSIFQPANEPEIEPHGRGNGICVCMLPLSLILDRLSERPGAVKGAPLLRGEANP
jgi:hypothetical protein